MIQDIINLKVNISLMVLGTTRHSYANYRMYIIYAVM